MWTAVRIMSMMTEHVVHLLPYLVDLETIFSCEWDCQRIESCVYGGQRCYT